MEKADEELAAVAELVRVSAADWIIGFHCQQIAEKVLKAILVSKEKNPERAHDLVYLIREISAAGIQTPEWFPHLGNLSPYAVQLRYEDLDSAADCPPTYAEILARRVHHWARVELGWNDEFEDVSSSNSAGGELNSAREGD